MKPQVDLKRRIPIYMDESHAQLVERAATKMGMSMSTACRQAAIEWARNIITPRYTNERSITNADPHKK